MSETVYRDQNFQSALQKSRLFQSMGEAELQRALTFFDARLHRYPKGAFLHAAGEPFERFGLVLSGSVQVCMDELDGTQMLMAHVGVGETFAESICFLKLRETPVYVTAVENTAVLWLGVERIYAGASDEREADFLHRFIGMLAQRTLRMNDRIQILSQPGLREKLLTFFTQQANLSGSSTFSIPMNRAGLAAYLCADRSAVSRELSRMKRDGLIDYYRNSFRILRGKDAEA